MAAIVLIIGLVAFLCFFTVRYSFEDAVKEVEKIDARHNISFSDYDKGIEYLYTHPPRDPLNSGEIDPVIREYSRIKGDEPVNLFIDFRKNFFEADKYYKLSHKTYKADLHKYGMQCKNEQYIAESLGNKNISAQRMNASLMSLLLLKEKYPDNFKMLGISEEWIGLYHDLQIDFKAEMRYNEDLFKEFCSNQTTNITN